MPVNLKFIATKQRATVFDEWDKYIHVAKRVTAF